MWLQAKPTWLLLSGIQGCDEHSVELHPNNQISREISAMIQSLHISHLFIENDKYVWLHTLFAHMMHAWGIYI